METPRLTDLKLPNIIKSLVGNERMAGRITTEIKPNHLLHRPSVWVPKGSYHIE